ncbi:hypothetical protein LTR94_027832, partial [Friedmanniomyces endolithicus]
ELLKLLAAADPTAAVRAMQGAGVLEAILPCVRPLSVFETLCQLSDDPVLRLAALLPADPASVSEVVSELRLSNAVRNRLDAVVAPGPEVSPSMGPIEARAAIYRLGRQAFDDRLVLTQAVLGDASALRHLEPGWTAPRLPVGGKDVARLGLAPGPQTGAVLKAFEEAWIAADFPDAGHQERLAALIAERA